MAGKKATRKPVAPVVDEEEDLTESSESGEELEAVSDGEEGEEVGEPPRGFGHEGKFADLHPNAQNALQEQWEALSPEERAKHRKRSHLKYRHA